MATILIDDERNLEADKVCRTYDEGILALQSQYWDLLLLDHDLGDTDPKKTGYGIMCWLEANPDKKPGRIQLVTMNVVGRLNMNMVIKNLYSSRDSG